MAQQGVIEHLRGPDRYRQAFAERPEGADVVSMVVRDQDGRYVGISQMQALQLFLDAADPYAGIDHDAGMRTQKQGTVPATSAGETDKPHHRRSSFSQ